MDLALGWAAKRIAEVEPSNAASAADAELKTEASGLVRSFDRRILEDALWTFRNAADLTDGRVKNQAIALLERAVADAPEGPEDLA